MEYRYEIEQNIARRKDCTQLQMKVLAAAKILYNLKFLTPANSAWQGYIGHGKFFFKNGIYNLKNLDKSKS